MTYHPWRHARDLGLTIEFVVGLRPRGTYAAGLVQIREGLSQRERRVVLAHEIVHCERGDDGIACSSWHYRKQERWVHLVAAQRLLPIEEIAAVRCDPDPANALWVDEYTLALRMRYLSEEEQAVIEDVQERSA